MPTSINLHDVQEIEIKETSLFKDDNGNTTTYCTDITIKSKSYGETSIYLFSSNKNKPITIRRIVMEAILKEFIDFVIEQQNDDGEHKQIMLDILDTFLIQKRER